MGYRPSLRNRPSPWPPPGSCPPRLSHTHALRSGAAPGSFIGFNTAREYQPDLGFFVAVDGAHRISRLLPSAALCSRAPPGSFYQASGGRGMASRRHALRPSLWRTALTSLRQASRHG